MGNGAVRMGTSIFININAGIKLLKCGWKATCSHRLGGERDGPQQQQHKEEKGRPNFACNAIPAAKCFISFLLHFAIADPFTGSECNPRTPIALWRCTLENIRSIISFQLLMQYFFCRSLISEAIAIARRTTAVSEAAITWQNWI